MADETPDVQFPPTRMTIEEIDEEILQRMNGERPPDNSRVSDLLAERGKKLKK
jgi:hypothetical protein